MGIQIKIIAALLFIAGVTLWFFLPKEPKAWYESSPDCPCNNPDKNDIKLQDGWANACRSSPIASKKDPP